MPIARIHVRPLPFLVVLLAILTNTTLAQIIVREQPSNPTQSHKSKKSDELTVNLKTHSPSVMAIYQSMAIQQASVLKTSEV